MAADLRPISAFARWLYDRFYEQLDARLTFGDFLALLRLQAQ